MTERDRLDKVLQDLRMQEALEQMIVDIDDQGNIIDRPPLRTAAIAEARQKLAAFDHINTPL